jgi:hypothetical protein
MTERGLHAEDARWPAGRSIVGRIRDDVNDAMSSFAEHGVEDPFRELYLRERDGCIPDELVDDDLLAGIHSMYYAVLDALCIELRERRGAHEPMNIVIDPSYEDTTNFVVHTFDKVLLSGGLKAWHFHWESEDEMAEQLEDWYQRAASALPRAREHLPIEGRYSVTLNLERVFAISAANATDAVEAAARWESNENDEAVQLDREKIVGHQVEPLRADPPASDGGGAT